MSVTLQLLYKNLSKTEEDNRENSLDSSRSSQGKLDQLYEQMIGSPAQKVEKVEKKLTKPGMLSALLK